MGKTAIEWTDFSVSPIRARNKSTGKVFHFCERISPGCALCYAATMAKRFGLPDYIKANRDKVEFFLDESKLQEVLRRRKPTRYFWEDCSDLFGEWVPNDWLDQCFAVMALTPHHTHQVLTKRAERMQDYMAGRSRSVRFWEAAARSIGYTLKFNGLSLCPFPLPNVWLGISAEDQKRADERIPHLLKTPAAVRFVSAEPLLGPIDFHDGFYRLTRDHTDEYESIPRDERLDWVIVGGESGPGARPFDVQWARSIVRQCKQASVPVFVKQVGAEPRSTLERIAEWPNWREKCHQTTGNQVWPKLNDSKGGDESEWPSDLRIREFPQAAFGGERSCE